MTLTLPPISIDSKSPDSRSPSALPQIASGKFKLQVPVAENHWTLPNRIPQEYWHYSSQNPELVKDPQIPLDNRKEQLTLSADHGASPRGIPQVLIHGTSRDGANMAPYKAYYDGPQYVMYIPEIEQSKGIHRIDVDNGIPESGQPAYVMILRDLGDFRIQLFQQRWQALKDSLDGRKTEKDRLTAIAAFFELPEKWPAALRQKVAKTIDQSVLLPIEKTPEQLVRDLGSNENLAAFTHRMVGRVQSEAMKVMCSKDVLPSVIDTSFLKQRVDQWTQNQSKSGRSKTEKKLNVDYRVNKPDSVNLRPVSLNEVVQFEAYGLYLEDQLRKNLQRDLSGYYSHHKRAFYLSSNEQVRQTAQHVMAKLFVVGKGLAHSQGAFGAHDVLVHAMMDMPKTYSDINSKKLETVKERNISPKHLPRRLFHGMRRWRHREKLFQPERPSVVLLRSAQMLGGIEYHGAPIRGVPDEQAWLQSFLYSIGKIFPESKKEQYTRHVVDFGWKQNVKDRTAMAEMRHDSYVIDWFKENEDAIEENAKLSPEGLSVLNVSEESDTIVPLESTRLYNKHGNELSNVSNCVLRLPSEPLDDKEVRAKAMRTISEIFKQIHVLPSLKFEEWPKSWQERIFKAFCGSMVQGAHQHSALIKQPETIDRTIPVFYLARIQNLINRLQPGNFRPDQERLLDVFTSVMTKLSPWPGDNDLKLQLNKALYTQFKPLTEALGRLYRATPDVDEGLHQSIARAAKALLGYADQEFHSVSKPGRDSTILLGVKELSDDLIPEADVTRHAKHLQKHYCIVA